MAHYAGNPKPLKKRLEGIKKEGNENFEAGEVEAVKQSLAGSTNKIYMAGDKIAIKAVVDGYTPPPPVVDPDPVEPTQDKWVANLTGAGKLVSYDAEVTIDMVEPVEEQVKFIFKQNGGNTKQKTVEPLGYKFSQSLNGSGANDFKLVLTSYNITTNANGYLVISFNDGKNGAHLFKDGKAIRAKAITFKEIVKDTPEPQPPVTDDKSVANLPGAGSLVSYDATVEIQAVEPVEETITFTLVQNGGNKTQKLVTPTGYKFSTSATGANSSDLKMVITSYNFITNDKGQVVIKFNSGKNDAHIFKADNPTTPIKAKAITITEKKGEVVDPTPTTPKTYAEIDNSKKLFGSQIKQTANFKITGMSQAGNLTEQEFNITGNGNPNFQVTPKGFYWSGSSNPLTLLNTAYDFFINEEGFFKLYASNTEFWIYSSKSKAENTKVKATQIINLKASEEE